MTEVRTVNFASLRFCRVVWQGPSSRLLARRLADDRVRPLIKEAEAEAAAAVLPAGLRERVRAILSEDEDLCWDEALEQGDGAGGLPRRQRHLPGNWACDH